MSFTRVTGQPYAVRPSELGRAAFTRIIQLIESGHIDTKPWITHHAGFGEMIERFPTWMRPEAGVIKAVVEIE